MKSFELSMRLLTPIVAVIFIAKLDGYRSISQKVHEIFNTLPLLDRFPVIYAIDYLDRFMRIIK